MRKYYRSIVMTVAAIVGVIATTQANSNGELVDWLGALVLALGAFNVFMAPDLTTWPWVKPVVAGSTFLATTVIEYADDNVISGHEWALVIAALAGWVLTFVRNDPIVEAVPRTGATAAARG